MRKTPLKSRVTLTEWRHKDELINAGADVYTYSQWLVEERRRLRYATEILRDQYGRCALAEAH